MKREKGMAVLKKKIKRRLNKKSEMSRLTLQFI